MRIPAEKFKYFKRYVNKEGYVKNKFFENLAKILNENKNYNEFVEKFITKIEATKIVLRQRYIGNNKI